MKKQIILGIDPGSKITGYGVISAEERKFSAVDYGCVRPPLQTKLATKNKIIFESVNALIDRYTPDVLVVERQFILKINPQSGLKLGMVAGVILLAASLRGIPIFAYAPSRAKLTVVGNGQASKIQVQSMIKHQLSLAKLPTPFDASDALALALCHGYMRLSPGYEKYLY